MKRFLSALALAVFALSANAKDAVDYSKLTKEQTMRQLAKDLSELQADVASAAKTNTVVLCEKSNDHASARAFNNAAENLWSKGYELKEVGKTVKKSTMTYVGTGLRVGMGPKGRRVLVMGSVEGSPARKTGFFEGRAFKVITIDGVPSDDMDVEVARKLMLGSGKAGTGVVLELVQYNAGPGEDNVYTRFVERQPITIPVETTCYKFALTKK